MRKVREKCVVAAVALLLAGCATEVPSPSTEPDEWLVLNIQGDGRLFVRGRCVFDFTLGADEQLINVLAGYRAEALASGRIRTRRRTTHNGELDVVYDPVLILAGEGVLYDWVARCNDACGDPSVACWKVMFSGRN